MEDKWKGTLAAAALAATLAPAAVHAEYGFYLGGDIGEVSVEFLTVTRFDGRFENLRRFSFVFSFHNVLPSLWLFFLDGSYLRIS